MDEERPQTIAPRPKPRRSGVVVPHAPRWFQRLAAWAVFLALRGVLTTVRYRLIDHSEYFGAPPASEPKDQPQKQAIYCLWHNRLAACTKAYHRFGRPRKPANGLAALVSASKDGALLEHILKLFHIQAVRGSSSRRGSQALLELTTWAERGYDLAITPDGPRGPCYEIQDGILTLAALTGLPILPLTFNLSGKISLHSWDRFQIPLPFARCEMLVGQPIFVPRELDAAQRAELRARIQRQMDTFTRD
ncbi:MAG: hypothetical protein RL380_166 [Verrucomicrobiota bacterium]